MGYPTPVRRCALRRVARTTEHRAVADVERRTASGERDDVIDGQVGSWMGGTQVARAPVTVLTAPGAEDAGAETLPGPRAVQGVVPAAVGLPSVLGTAAARAAGDDTADRAELHPRIVDGRAGAVYSPAVLGLRDQYGANLHGPGRALASQPRVEVRPHARCRSSTRERHPISAPHKGEPDDADQDAERVQDYVVDVDGA